MLFPNEYVFEVVEFWSCGAMFVISLFDLVFVSFVMYAYG